MGLAVGTFLPLNLSKNFLYGATFITASFSAESLSSGSSLADLVPRSVSANSSALMPPVVRP